MESCSIKLTVMFDTPFWVGIFERHDHDGYASARVVFGAEPTEVELYEFLINDQGEIRFTTPQKEEGEVIKKKSPKRVKREVKKSLKNVAPMSKAQEALRVELEKNKKERKQQSRLQREEKKQKLFDMKQEKRKEKKRGH